MAFDGMGLISGRGTEEWLLMGGPNKREGDRGMAFDGRGLIRGTGTEEWLLMGGV